ncbi:MULTISPECIES: GGDEF domain-containing protein [Cupriavidus]|uniref:GGDEF domain-containing protein n=1 Tax=Cupriavidus TaxID=106589 RepID=UPI00037E078B|nr:MULTISPECIES: diguanylate cyclase [Cupriavidus]
MPLEPSQQARLHELALARMGCGVFVVDREHRIALWNHFMADRSGVSAEAALGQRLLGLFPELPAAWLRRTLESVFLLKISAFTSWEHRPYLFRFPHDLPVTCDFEWMRQDCEFLPLMEGDEVIAVCVTILDATELAIAQRARDEAVDALREASIRDALTGLYNRRYIEDRLQEEFHRWRKSGRALSVLIFDLDHFKRINDDHGHPGGDAVLKAVAQRVAACLRDRDVVARYGGEEFAVLLPNTAFADAIAVAERIRGAIRAETVRYAGHAIAVSASVGVAQACHATASADQLVHQADEALYRAKAAGRNRVAF